MSQTAWYTSHAISEKIMLSVSRGFRIPAKHTSLFHKHKDKNEAILYGILRGCSDVMHNNFKNGVSYLHIDLGYIGRGHFDGYYRFSLNNTQAHYIDVDLPSERAKKLDITLRDWQDNEAGIVLIIPPTEPIAIFYGIDIEDWINKTIKKINGHPYKVRYKNDAKPIEEDFKIAKCAITFNSNSALDATIWGVPVIATSSHSIIKSWNSLTMADFADCYKKSIGLNREKLINYISYHQFTLDEVEKGIAPAIIKEMRQEGVY